MSSDRRDEQDYSPPEHGVRSSDVGSFLPDASYRPVPIVWFTAAMFLQIIGLLMLFVMLQGLHPVFTTLASLMLSVLIGSWTFGRGMANAAAGWRIATLVALAFNCGLVALGAFAMGVRA